MTIPVEIIVWGLAGIFALLSINAHILLRVYGSISKVCQDHAVDKTKVDSEIASLNRHQRRNDEEINQMRRWLDGHRNPKGQPS